MDGILASNRRNRNKIPNIKPKRNGFSTQEKNEIPFFTPSFAEQESSPGVWKRVLYTRSSYPDNYVETSFLDYLLKNGEIIIDNNQ